MTEEAPWKTAAKPVLEKLRDVGYDVESFAQLRDSGVRYRDAVPVLVEALAYVKDAKALEGIVRALSVPWAKPAATGPLIELFRRLEGDSGLGWAVGNALEVIWHDAYFDDLVAIAQDKSKGRSREMIVMGMAKSKRPEIGEVLIELLDDRDVNGHATFALRKLRVPAARAGLEGMLDDDRAWVRKDAKRALAAMD